MSVKKELMIAVLMPFATTLKGHLTVIARADTLVMVVFVQVGSPFGVFEFDVQFFRLLIKENE